MVRLSRMEARLPLAAALPAIASVAGIGSSIYQGVNNANATNDAAKAQQQAAAQAAANFAPYLGAGNAALNAQLNLLGLGSSTPGGASQAAPNYAAYVTGNPDILAAYQSGAGKGASIEDFGKWHWNTFGSNEASQGNPNRTLTPFGPAGANGAGAGAGAQQSAIDQLKQSPYYQSLYHNGEQATLANAAATGGLRGGNAERSLYNLGTDTLASAYQQQFNNLGSITGLGENAAAGTGNAQLLGSQFQAGGILGSAKANNSLAGSIAGIPSVFGNSSVLNALGLNNGGVSTGTTMTAANAPAGVSSLFDGLF
jgi:hypothetical protein